MGTSLISRRGTRILAFAAVLIVALSGMNVIASTPANAAPTSRLIFNDPNSATQRRAISSALRTLINGAEAGSTIRIAIYLFNDTATAGALVNAKNRGVNVQVVHSQVDDLSASVRSALVRALGTNPNASSFITYCGGACIGSGNLMHNKLALFSRVSGAGGVVFSTSANFKSNGSGDGAWNNAVQVVGNTSLYNYFVGYFSDLKHKRKNSDYYAARPPKTFGAYRPYFFPRGETDADPIISVLNGVDCSKRNPNTGTKYGQTVIKVVMAYFTRRDVAEKLLRMDNAGCYVQVVYNQNNLGYYAGCAILDRSGPFNGIQSWYFPTGAAAPLHSKYLAIEGYYFGYDKKIVWTGSHNYTYPALRANDETMIRLVSNSVYNAFAANMHDVVTAPGIRERQARRSSCG